MRARRPKRRRCDEPRKGVRCQSTRTATPGQLVLDERIRGTCRRRRDFTGRGFGRERQREAR